MAILVAGAIGFFVLAVVIEKWNRTSERSGESVRERDRKLPGRCLIAAGMCVGGVVFAVASAVAGTA
ncbi:hypothetical protein GCM10023353_38170 [Tomitella cavernea]|uniref:Uncharacterized protein n=2 Tax=Tomitella cavernea TaxID=1387982 RepID=A0ABP9D1P8_9ACTN